MNQVRASVKFADYHHDHDEELGMYWYESPAKGLLHGPRPRRGDIAYWLETGNLVREYLMLRAGVAYSETLRQGCVTWLQASPERRQQYESGDDMQRAALVDWFMRVVR